MEYKLLIVDDEKAILEFLYRSFLVKGFQSKAALNGVEALDLMKKEEFDVILLDIEMPKMDGLAVLKFVKSKFPDTRVIVVTGYSEYKTKAAEFGCDNFITKPFTLEAIDKAVQEQLDLKFSEERQGISLGTKLTQAKKGEILAGVLLLEDNSIYQEVLAKQIETAHGASFKVHAAANAADTLGIQELFNTDIVLMNLSSTDDPMELVDKLKRQAKPPKGFIYYMNQLVELDKEALKRSKGKLVEGFAMNGEGIGRILDVLKETAISEGLVKA